VKGWETPAGWGRTQKGGKTAIGKEKRNGYKMKVQTIPIIEYNRRGRTVEIGKTAKNIFNKRGIERTRKEEVLEALPILVVEKRKGPLRGLYTKSRAERRNSSEKGGMTAYAASCWGKKKNPPTRRDAGDPSGISQRGKKGKIADAGIRPRKPTGSS